MCRYHANGTATTFADKTVVLRDGIIEQVGTPVDLYERTDNTFVAQSIGSPTMNLSHLKIGLKKVNHFCQTLILFWVCA
jgi:ABC-type sugar transport system ATPase subunit